MNRFLQIVVCLFLTVSPAFAQSEPSPESTSARPTVEIVRLSWEASHKSDIEALNVLVNEILKGYESEAKRLASMLKDFPPRDKFNDFKTMSDLATVLFIKAEALRNQGKTEEAKKQFTDIITQYPWAQSWDPSRGSYWSIAEKSQAAIDLIEGKESKQPVVKVGPPTQPTLVFTGEKVVDYSKYGKFLNPGTTDYRYQIEDRKGLAKAVGEGIYPNLTDVYADPNYKKVLKSGRMEGSHWDFINTPDLQAAFYKWVTAPEPWGVKLFYLGIIFEKAKMYYQAVKCYQALIIHYPGTLAWTYWHTPWFPAQAAISKIQHILLVHPELKLEFKSAKIQILNSFDNDPNNKFPITQPGSLRLLASEQQAREASANPPKIALGEVVKTLGTGRVHFAKYATGHWQLVVDDKPFLIKGITYTPTKVGQGPDNGTLTNWMDDDPNPAFTAWVDVNHNGIQDQDEPNVGDFALMKQMGVNVLRIYHHPMKPNKELLKKMYEEYGLRVIMGDYVGKYALGSGATWAEGTDYENPEHQKKMLESIKTMVMEFKDEPYVLFWLLGNENNYGVASNADKKPEAYFKFINEAARMIKSIDSNHPVALCNGDTLFLDKFGQLAPDVDAYGGNVYRGDYGFGSFWQQVAEAADRPAFITEYGAPAYSGPSLTAQEAIEAQAEYHKGNWLDIYHNSAGFSDGEGNAVGGIAFEWLDEWWKNYEPSNHDTKADVLGPFPGGYYFEEWFGLFGQGNGRNSPYLREPRKVYYVYKDLWASE